MVGVSPPGSLSADCITTLLACLIEVSLRKLSYEFVLRTLDIRDVSLCSLTIDKLLAGKPLVELTSMLVTFEDPFLFFGSLRLKLMEHIRGTTPPI